jgi:cellulose synthase/poly-beta-1,6-N-acetylglucosamine synthase-like glycosyltransferase
MQPDASVGRKQYLRATRTRHNAKFSVLIAMMMFASWCLGIMATCVAVPCTFFFVEIIAACLFAPKQLTPQRYGSARVAVLVPAHNEGAGLRPTLLDLKSQLGERDRLIVVADNCTDTTATVAASLGAEVTIRDDLTKIGKGYALDWGVKHLAADPPDVVIVIDADCRVEAGAIDKLVTTSIMKARPVQARYLMSGVAGSLLNHQVSEFAWRVKNWVRPLGLDALALPCHLMGSGMAFPWKIIHSVELANGCIVEDLKLGLDLAVAGTPPVFCPSARVTSNFANSSQGLNAQRQRWEHGHVRMIWTAVPYLIKTGIKQRDVDLLALTLDLMVPPLTFLILISGFIFALSVLAVVGGAASSVPLEISVTSIAVVFFATGLAWFKFGRDALPRNSLALVPGYIAAKLPIYRTAFLGRGVSNWIRSDRDS